MKDNKIYSYATTLFALINITKEIVKPKLACYNNRVELLEKSHAFDRRLTQMFCNYVFLSVGSKPSQTNQIVEVDLRTKIIIKDDSQSSCDIAELMEDLAVYYSDYTVSNNIAFSIHTQLDWISLPMAKESFYQIIFSLIESKLQFLGNGDELCLNIEQIGDKLVLSIQDNGFLLTAVQIKKYAKTVVARSNLFFLSWDELIGVLDFYGYNYELKNEHNTNHLQIEFDLNGIAFANQNDKAILN